MPKPKKSRAIDLAQRKLIEHIKKLAQTTSGQLAKNHVELMGESLKLECKLLGAIEEFFTTKTAKSQASDET